MACHAMYIMLHVTFCSVVVVVAVAVVVLLIVRMPSLHRTHCARSHVGVVVAFAVAGG